MNRSSIEIDRVPLNVVAAASRERAEALTNRVRDALARSLPAALEGACGRTLDTGDRQVFIDRLDVQCAVGSHWDDDAIGRAFAARLAQALLSGVDSGTHQAFRDRTEYVAAFIAARADGVAHSRWWFDEFAGLAPLPPSAAMRTLMVTDPATTIAALARLTPATFARVMSLVSVADAACIIRTIAAAVPGTADPTAREISDAIAAARTDDPAAPKERLVSLVVLERLRAGGGGARTLARIDAVHALRRAAAEGRLHGWLDGGGTDEEILAACCAEAGMSPPFPVSGADCAPVLEQLRRLSRDTSGAQSRSADDVAILYTAHGGALLLAALLARLGWWDGWRTALAARRTSNDRANAAAGALALEVAARALSPRSWRAVMADSTLRQTFGAAHTRTTRLPRTVAEDVASAPRRVLREFARRLPGCEGSSADYLRRECLACSASVSIDGERLAVRTGRVPLAVLLGIAGLDRADVMLPGGRRLVIRTEGPA